MEELEGKPFIFTMWNCINLEHSNGQISRAENTYTNVEYKYYMKQPATYEHVNPQALISICSFVGTEIPNAFA